MKLRVEGTLDKPRVVNADTGEELQGVDRVEWDSGYFKKCTIYLKYAAIDVSIDASRVDAVTTEDGKYAHTRLLDIARLRWRK